MHYNCHIYIILSRPARTSFKSIHAKWSYILQLSGLFITLHEDLAVRFPRTSMAPEKYCLPNNSKVAKYEEINYEMAEKLSFVVIETRKCSNM